MEFSPFIKWITLWTSSPADEDWWEFRVGEYRHLCFLEVLVWSGESLLVSSNILPQRADVTTFLHAFSTSPLVVPCRWSWISIFYVAVTIFFKIAAQTAWLLSLTSINATSWIGEQMQIGEHDGGGNSLFKFKLLLCLFQGIQALFQWIKNVSSVFCKHSTGWVCCISGILQLLLRMKARKCWPQIIESLSHGIGRPPANDHIVDAIAWY